MSAIILDEVYLIILDEIYLMKYPPIKQFPDDLQQFQDNVIRFFENSKIISSDFSRNPTIFQHEKRGVFWGSKITSVV